MKKSRSTVTDMSTIKVCTLGVGISVVLLIIVAVLSTIFISNEYISMDSGEYIAWVAQFVACFVGCTVSGKIARDKKALVCGIVAAINFLVVLFVAVLLFDGLANNILLCLLPIAAACGCAILLSIRTKSHSGSRKRRAFSR